MKQFQDMKNYIFLEVSFWELVLMKHQQGGDISEDLGCNYLNRLAYQNDWLEMAEISDRAMRVQRNVPVQCRDGFNDIGYHQNSPSSANPKGLPTTNTAAGIMPTPNLDRLSEEGVKLEAYYVQPLCSPTRSTIMTGRYPSMTGIGPDVIVIDCPYGVPAREKFLPELLRESGYTTRMVGKWHLGACHEGYLPTNRGFDSYMGYLAGAQGYYGHSSDRNGSGALPSCMGNSAPKEYSTILWTNEAARIAKAHNPKNPLFFYLAFQSVHNPYDVPPESLIGNVNNTFPEIYEYGRRIYAGMVLALDYAVGNVTNAWKSAGLWDDTIMVFTTDNGGIEYGNNYPLRGAKVMNWEGGVRGVAFVRGTNSDLAKIPAGSISHELMHTTDWLPTLCHLAGADTSTTLPLAGFNQWDVLSNSAKTNRTYIIHNVPVVAKPIILNISGKQVISTSTCLSHIDNRTGPCHAFGITGGAIRVGEYKLLITYAGKAPWGDSSSPGIAQYTPGGHYPNRTAVFVPSTNDSIPKPYNSSYFLFHIPTDPTETYNLAATLPVKLKELISFYDNYSSTTAILPLSWRYGFKDPDSSHSPDGCTGPFVGSPYCAYGHEFDCYIKGSGLEGSDVGHKSVNSPSACQQSCSNHSKCNWWVFEDETKDIAEDETNCRLKSNKGSTWACRNCYYGPKSILFTIDYVMTFESC
eukprot:UC4_evm3s1573